MISSPCKKKVKDGASCMVPELAELEFLIMISVSANFICLKFEKVVALNFPWLIYDETSDAPAVKLVKSSIFSYEQPMSQLSHKLNLCLAWKSARSNYRMLLLPLTFHSF
ncbi:uncharacterized protein LOC121249103 isoform X2 [Juglans microcarpa x Juglans regia]|uniref:uncharacterized protein LOC121249103 isoform X2 n=1 Tax=Juglans microcarpa x Juglans regia TaxID=2249226 RepID=UPI001B7E4164|nr:uncharacterized protein LOC121249103 isoform X2 [Juglans microcarpa x Juglans regia]